MKQKAVIVMCPTVLNAVYGFEVALKSWPEVIEKANKSQRYVELFGGLRVYFKAETEGQRALRGFHADIISFDVFMGKGKEDGGRK